VLIAIALAAPESYGKSGKYGVKEIPVSKEHWAALNPYRYEVVTVPAVPVEVQLQWEAFLV
jgi:hypothetical protein